MKICEKCGFEYSNATNYCQKCGNHLKSKDSLKSKLEHLNLDSIAGLGSKGISVAPVTTGHLLDGQIPDENTQDTPAKVMPLKDGSWYCPKCGVHNKTYKLYCENCGFDK